MNEQLDLFDILAEIEEQSETEEATELIYSCLDDIIYESGDEPIFSTHQASSFYHSIYFHYSSPYDDLPDVLREKDYPHFLSNDASSRNFRYFINQVEGFLTFFESMNIFSGLEAEELKHRTNAEEVAYAHLYKPTFLVEAFEQLPLINYRNPHEKIHAFTVILLNALFPYFTKHKNGDEYIIELPESFFFYN